MAASKRVLAALAAGALIAPLSPFASPAFAQTFPTVDIRSIEIACPSNQLPENEFTDVDDDSTFEDEITCIREYEVTSGVTATTYNPSGFVTRQQMAGFIANILREAGLELDTRDAGFTDLENVGNQGLVDSINALANAGVVVGTTPTATERKPFSPKAEVRRDQMASFIAQAQEALDRGVTTDEDFFRDDEGNVHEDNINIIASEGITGGRGGAGNYDPRSNVTREQMAAFLARKIDILVEEGLIEPRFEPGADVVIDDETVTAGDPITGEITGDNIESVSVDGDCVTAGELTDEDATAEGFQFSIDTDEAATEGDCDIEFTLTFENGREQVITETVTIEEGTGTPTPITGATEAPDLLRAEFVSTTDADMTAGNNNSSSVFRFIFDEQVVANAIDATDFRVVSANSNTFFTGDSAVRDPQNPNAVLVTFNEDAVTGPDDAFNAGNIANLTLATVGPDAVIDVDGNGNPIGDAPLGTGVAGNTAGTTAAPDLQSIGNFRASESNTLVDFVFDENAFVLNGGAGQFQLILTNGDDVAGSAIVNQTTTDAGDFQGDGTTTITVAFPFGQSSGAQVTAAEVVRGIVLENTVSDADPTNATGGATGTAGNANPLQATENPDGASSSPDLVSVAFNRSTSTSTATFTFDQNVTLTPNSGASFGVFDANGDETNAAANGATQEVVADNTIVVTFPNAAIESAVGGNVLEGAVRGAAATGQPNQEDEEAGTGTDSGTAAGRTNGPDLIAVDSANTTTTTGSTTRVTAVSFTFTFDEAVFNATNGRFFAVQPNGDMVALNSCTVNAFNAGTTDAEENTVTCTVSDASGTTANETDAVVNSVGGAVERDAVDDNLGNQNPRGFEAIA